MNGRCRGICQQYKFKACNPRESKYEQGASRCNNACEIFITWIGVFCPCCGVRLRKSCKNKHSTRKTANIISKKQEIPSVISTT